MSDRYLLRDSLGRGGMGEVFLADDTQLGRRVAIKFLSPDLEQDGTAGQRLRREARSAAGLDHPYICKIHEIAEIDGRTGIVMEHVSGETLQARLQTARPEPADALRIAGEVAEALAEAHRRQLIHRDLKPANVMLTAQGHVKVMDFGLAKPVGQLSSDPAGAETMAALTEAGVRVGTPGYMAPEQILGGVVDERSDIFAFGVLLYELLAGVHPFTRATTVDTMAAILREPVVALTQHTATAPPGAGQLLDRLLAKEPNGRYQSFAAVEADLRQLARPSSQATGLRSTAGAEAVAASGRTPYVGRETERADARQLLDQLATSAQGGLLFLGGEPGVGKTRLAEEFLAEARERGCLTLTGRCYEAEGTPPFIPWVEIVERSARIVAPGAFRETLGGSASEVARLVPSLRQRFDDIPPPVELPAAQQRHYLFTNFLAFVERGARITPHVLLLDDLHWADQSTLHLLEHLVPHLGEMPMVIVGTYRDVDLDVARPFPKALETLTRQRLARKLALKRLPEGDVVEMLAALGGQDPPRGLATIIYRETEGNPFFVEEVFQHLLEEGQLFDAAGQWRADLDVDTLDVPEGIRLVLGRRIERLDVEQRKLLTTAAIVGRSFSLSLMEAAGGGDEDEVLSALEAAEAAKLIVPVRSRRDPRWEFAHGLIRQTLVNSLSLPRRQRAHLRVAEGLERVHAGDIERFATDLAHHLDQAGAAADPSKTVRFLQLAAEQALETGAFDEVLLYTDKALEILDEIPALATETPLLPADLLYRRGQAHRSLGRGHDDAALKAWRQAQERYKALFARGDIAAAAGIAASARAAGMAQMWGGDVADAESTIQDGLTALGNARTPALSRLLAVLAWCQSVAGNTRGVQTATEALSLAEDIGDERLVAEVLHAKSFCHNHARQPLQCKASALRAAATFRKTFQTWDLADVVLMVAISTHYVDPGEALDRADEADALAAQVAHDGAACMAANVRNACRLVIDGRLGLVEHSVRELIERSQHKGWISTSYGLLATTLFWAGRWVEAEHAWRDAIQREPPGVYSQGGLQALVTRALAYQSTPRVLDELRTIASDLPSDDGAHRLGVWLQVEALVEGFAMLNRRDEVAGLYPVVRQGLEIGDVITGNQQLWQMLAGMAAGAGQQWAAAEDHFETALRQAHTLPHKIAQPEVRRWYAWMLLDRRQPGDEAKARMLLDEAVEMYGAIGMPKHLELSQQLLARI